MRNRPRTYRYPLSILLLALFIAIPVLSFIPTNSKGSSSVDALVSIILSAGIDDVEQPIFDQTAMPRRSLVRGALVVAMTLSGTSVSSPLTACAADDDDAPNGGVVSRDRVADLLHRVPTFTIVDKQGVPFMVVGEDAKVTGYFFTSYEEASRILKLASDSADKSIAQAKREKLPEASDLTNPWKLARISTIPLDTAVTLSLQAGSRNIRNYFQVAAAATDIDDALNVAGKDDLPEGKVPLFYYEDFSLDGSSPLYFQKSQLEKAYRASHLDSNEPPPEVLVTELFAVLTAMVQPVGKDTDLQSLVFVPPTDSIQRAAQCIRYGGKEAPFVLGQRNIIL